MPAPKDPIKCQDWKRKISETMKKLGLKPPLRLGIKHTEETRKKIRESYRGLGMTGKKHTKEAKRKIGLANSIILKGRKLSEETRKKMSLTRKGRLPGTLGKYWKLSEITKRKMSEGKLKRKERLGYINSLETRKKISLANKGKKLSEERKRKMSEDWKGDKNPTKRIEVREKISRALKGEKNPNWQGGISFEPYSPAWTPILRQAIRERDKYTCQLCGKYPAFNCHHIDYDKKNCEPENLITLCDKCHGKTSSNKEYWKKYFHLIIDKKYA